MFLNNTLQLCFTTNPLIWQQNVVDEWKNGGKVEVVLGRICSKILKSRVVVVVVVVVEDDEVDI